MLIRRYRHFQLSARIIKTILKGVTYVPPDCPHMWKQEFLREVVDDHDVVYDELLTAIEAAVGHRLVSRFTCVIHNTMSDIPPHDDSMSKTCFIIPLRITPTQQFYVETKSVHMKVGELIRFNDFYVHGIHNPNWGRLVVMSVTLDR